MALSSGKGTRIIRRKDGYVSIIPPDAEYNEEDGDHEIMGVVSIDIQMRVDEIVTAIMEIRMEVCRVDAESKYIVIDPDTGEYKPIKYIQFEDGSRWEA